MKKACRIEMMLLVCMASVFLGANIWACDWKKEYPCEIESAGTHHLPYLVGKDICRVISGRDREDIKYFHLKIEDESDENKAYGIIVKQDPRHDPAMENYRKIGSELELTVNNFQKLKPSSPNMVVVEQIFNVAIHNDYSVRYVESPPGNGNPGLRVRRQEGVLDVFSGNEINDIGHELASMVRNRTDADIAIFELDGLYLEGPAQSQSKFFKGVENRHFVGSVAFCWVGKLKFVGVEALKIPASAGRRSRIVGASEFRMKKHAREAVKTEISRNLGLRIENWREENKKVLNEKLSNSLLRVAETLKASARREDI